MSWDAMKIEYWKCDDCGKDLKDEEWYTMSAFVPTPEGPAHSVSIKKDYCNECFKKRQAKVLAAFDEEDA